MKKKPEEKYEARALEVCRRLSGDKRFVALVCNDIVKRYQEPHRAYHTLKHINECLDEFERVKSLLQNPDAVEMGILCHDAVYNVRSDDNEEKSAEFAKKIVKVLGLADLFGERVAELIIATKHDVPPSNFDAQVLVDIDLASLGYSEREFDRNTAKIRREYPWLTNEQFNKGRADFLKTLLPPNRPAIFLTPFFRDKYEEQARKNLFRAIAQLSQ